MNRKMLRRRSAWLAWGAVTIALGVVSCDRFSFLGPGKGNAVSSSRIIFASDTVNPLAAGPLTVFDPASSEVWSIRPDGSGLLRLTTNDLYDGQPSVSADGRTVVFVGDSRLATFADVRRQLFAVNADGTNERELALSSNGDETDPAISPDGQYVAFISDRDGNAELYVGEINGSDAVRMTTTPDDSEAAPAWSPDGNWIAFIRRVAGVDGAELWETTSPYSPILGPPGPVNITALVREKDPDFLKQYNTWASPDWSPDGKRIAFSARYEGLLAWYVPSKVFIVDLETYQIFRPEDPTLRPVNYSLEEDPSWSPDGSQIVFTASVPSLPKLVMIRSSGFRLGEISIGKDRRCWQADWGRGPRIR